MHVYVLKTCEWVEVYNSLPGAIARANWLLEYENISENTVYDVLMGCDCFLGIEFSILRLEVLSGVKE